MLLDRRIVVIDKDECIDDHQHVLVGSQNLRTHSPQLPI